jgi:hypothetical protein
MLTCPLQANRAAAARTFGPWQHGPAAPSGATARVTASQPGHVTAKSWYSVTCT